ncbi:2311_t:CDS:2 [Rhizophagus irregularis]|nr:2311_t:CDS:2 [Rhizophagus irregularis]
MESHPLKNEFSTYFLKEVHMILITSFEEIESAAKTADTQKIRPLKKLNNGYVIELNFIHDWLAENNIKLSYLFIEYERWNSSKSRWNSILLIFKLCGSTPKTVVGYL